MATGAGGAVAPLPVAAGAAAEALARLEEWAAEREEEVCGGRDGALDLLPFARLVVSTDTCTGGCSEAAEPFG